MKLVSYLDNAEQYQDGIEGKLGLVLDDSIVVNLLETAPRYLAVAALSDNVSLEALTTMCGLLGGGEAAQGFARDVAAWAEDHRDDLQSRLLSDLHILAPVPRPTTMRDGYAFRQHVEAARRNRGVEMIPEFDQFPVFYFTNPFSTAGPGDVKVMERHLERLDFELECAVVLGKSGRNIKASGADEYIFGYMVFNDWSARAMQMQEMKLSLGPAKGKDFANTFGPWLATPDELVDKKVPGEQGERYDLTMTAKVNGVEVSRGNLKDMTWTFAQIIERASYGVTLQAGDVIGSGTVGTGCFLELNGSGITNQWLQDGDEVELEIERLGALKNRVVKVG
ncbi:MAG: fumarylacetoacetate hydrolase family protein [Chlorobi bacterium]|nr:fumarylacetoacetate hydrolase family protein [Chlorobiota bacterium]